jgi:protein TonB
MGAVDRIQSAVGRELQPGAELINAPRVVRRRRRRCPARGRRPRRTRPPVERLQPSKLVAANTPPGSREPARPATPTTQPSTVTDAPFPGQIEADRPALPAPESAPASNLEEGVSGVESIANVSAQRAVASIAPGTLVSADELDTAPVSLSRKVPAYSLQARQMRAEGTVVMKLLVNERGTVDEVVLVDGVTGPGLNDAAMRAAKSWTYRPATKGGVPVKVWKIEQVAFKL